MKQTLIALAALALMAAGCSTTNQNTSSTTSVTNSGSNGEEQLVLANLGGVTFAPHMPGQQTAGDIQMTKDAVDERNGLISPVVMFGQTLPGKDTVVKNPNFEFSGLARPINIVSAIDGVVGFVRQQADSGDVEVFLQPAENSSWTIGYDHVTGVTVKQGDRVTVGQVIGQAAPYRNGTYRYELQVNRETAGQTTFHCPTDLLAASVRTQSTAAIEQFINDWNAYMGRDVYGAIDTACTAPTLTAAETQ